MEISPLWETLREAAARASTLLLSSAVKGSLVFVASAAVALVMRRAHPRLRSFVWLFASAAWLIILASQLLTLPALVEVPNPFRQPSLRGGFSSVIAPRGPAAAAARTDAAAAPGAAVMPFGAAGTPTEGPAAAIPPLLAAAWAAGALLASLRTIVGRVQLVRLVRSAKRVSGGSLAHLLDRQRETMRIRRPVSLLVSARCATPFTWREARPLVVLPAGAEGWSRQKARAVLLHELAHVAWHDQLARGLARVACAVFWFVPPAWIAASLLAAEQEMACDSAAVEAGAEAGRYARCLLDFARGSTRPLLFQRTGLAGRRRQELEGRIRSIMRGGRVMKKGRMVLAAIVLAAAAVIVLAGAGTRERQTPETAWAMFVGTWENPSYAGPQPFTQKMVVKPDLSGEDWLYVDSPSRDATWVVKPARFWTDSKGDLYLQFYNTYVEPVTASGVATGRGRVLMRLSADGQTVEITGWFWGTENGPYPEKIDTAAKAEYGSIYYIYHRKP